jgi:hypothetical protein
MIPRELELTIRRSCEKLFYSIKPNEIATDARNSPTRRVAVYGRPEKVYLQETQYTFDFSVFSFSN